MKRIFFITILAMLITSCSTYNLRPGDDTTLIGDQAIVITALHSNIEGVTVMLHRYESTYASAVFLDIEPPSDFRIFKMKAGLSGFTKLTHGGLYTERNSNAFTVEAGKINYIGDFFMDWDLDGDNKNVYSRYHDYESETVREAKALYPELFKKYPYVNVSPRCQSTHCN